MMLYGEHNFRHPAFEPLSFRTFIKYFLIPHIAVIFTADDQQTDLEGGWESMTHNSDHGDIMQALLDDDAELEEIFAQNGQRRQRRLEAANRDPDASVLPGCMRKVCSFFLF